jgi:hypothetical protein
VLDEDFDYELLNDKCVAASLDTVELGMTIVSCVIALAAVALARIIFAWGEVQYYRSDLICEAWFV